MKSCEVSHQDFVSILAYATYMDKICNNRPLALESEVFLNEIGDDIITKWIKRINWQNLMKIKGVAYPHLVKLFYANIHGVEMKKLIFKTKVCGKDIVVTLASITSTLKVSRGDVHLLYPLKANFQHRHKDFIANLPSTRIKPRFRILHRILFSTALPKCGHFNHINDFGLYLINAMRKGDKLDLGTIIWHNIVEHSGKSKKNICMPHGILISKIITGAGVPPHCMCIQQDSPISRLSVSRMTSRTVYEQDSDNHSPIAPVAAKTKDLYRLMTVTFHELDSDNDYPIVPGVVKTKYFYLLALSNRSRLDLVVEYLRKTCPNFPSSSLELNTVSSFGSHLDLEVEAEADGDSEEVEAEEDGDSEEDEEVEMEADGDSEEVEVEADGPPVQQQYPPLQQGGGRGAGQQGGRGWGPSQPQQGGRGGYSGGPQGGPQQGSRGRYVGGICWSNEFWLLVEDLARLSFQTTPVYIDVDYGRSKVTVEGLQQGYCVAPSDEISSSIFILEKEFIKESDEKGILLCTDVAARGLDIPAVDWIVQHDPPDEPKEYVHRVGQTARGEGGKGHALLFLLPEELKFLSYLKAAKVPLKEYEFDQTKLANVQSHLVFGKDGRGRVLGLGSGVSKTTLMAASPYKRKAKEVVRSKLEFQSQIDDLKQKVIDGKNTQMEIQSQVNAMLTMQGINQGAPTRISTNSPSD
ncbi:hypothetical protein IFM89_014197 [Coptis chinensis]|uniref:ATP-dependent RNA helicase n=1 Tax=Coptis chinensis TaxID=261450 RepID=A0A835IYX7_9MAGN|nr:hypothetical protein IFM89_014197 [Coptis chinensis]